MVLNGWINCGVFVGGGGIYSIHISNSILKFLLLTLFSFCQKIWFIMSDNFSAYLIYKCFPAGSSSRNTRCASVCWVTWVCCHWIYRKLLQTVSNSPRTMKGTGLGQGSQQHFLNSSPRTRGFWKGWVPAKFDESQNN